MRVFSKYTLPDVILYSFIIDLPVVVFPQPLSPTSPKTSPFLTSKLTPSTALSVESPDLKY